MAGKKCGEWRCGGGGLGAQSIVYGMHPDGIKYQFAVDAPPLVTDFAAINWFCPFGATAQSGQPTPPPSAAAAPAPNLQQVYADLFQAFGEPFIKAPRSYSVNQPFFARLWGRKRLAFYERTVEEFYAYNPTNGLFERLREDQVLGFLSTDIIAEGFARKFNTIAGKINSGLLQSVLRLIKSDPEVCQTNFFKLDLLANPVIHAANGMVVLENDSAVLYPFDPKYRSRNQIPIDYVEGAPCVIFKTTFLQPVLTDADDIELLQRYCGLILVGGNRAQKILMLLGGGGTGKGTITRLLTLVIGRENIIQLRVDQLSGRFETARVVGKLLLNVVEATANYLNREGAEVVKALCGHDVMEGEKKFRNDPISFDGTFPIIVTSNEALNVRLSGDETAQTRRLAIIEFPDSRGPDAEIIEHFEEILFAEEGEGIFAWMIAGALAHWKELQQKTGFKLSAAQQKRVETLIGRSRSIDTFITTKLEKGDDVTVEELYDAYCGFCGAYKWVPFLEQRFEEQSRYLIQRHFGLGRRNDVLRKDANGKLRNKRGYRLKLK